MNDKNREQFGSMSAKRFGHTDLQKRIIELGRKGQLTAGKIIELFGGAENKDATDELFNLMRIGLIKFDKNTMNEKKGVCWNTKIIWTHKKGTKMPLDPGETVHNPSTDFFYEQQEQFITHYKDCICQKCGEKSEVIFCMSLDCDVEENDDFHLEYSPSPSDMIVICKKCRDELVKWLDIPVQDNL